MSKVFLGGTCNNSKWREQLISLLVNVDYFNPVVDDWNEEAQQREIQERKNCDFCLYVITPLMTGVYSIAEVIDDSNKRPEKTLFCVLKSDELPNGDRILFDQGQLRSLESVKNMAKRNGAHVFEDLKEIATFLNEENYEN